MNGWLLVSAVAVAAGLISLWLGRESRTREPEYWDDGSVVLPCDIHRARYVFGCLSIGLGVFALLLGNQPDVSRADWLFFTVCSFGLLASALGLRAASRMSASFTPAGISLQHPLQSVQIPWPSFRRLEPGPYFTARLVVTPSDDVLIESPRLLRARALRSVQQGVVDFAPQSLVGGYSMFAAELVQAQGRLAPKGEPTDSV